MGMLQGFAMPALHGLLGCSHCQHDPEQSTSTCLRLEAMEAMQDVAWQ
jgi:hypothetical protein